MPPLQQDYDAAPQSRPPRFLLFLARCGWKIQAKDIFGCEATPPGKYLPRHAAMIAQLAMPYMTRYTLIDRPGGQLCVHVFHRSDHDVPHDHPWNFVSLILHQGYTEEVRVPNPDPAAPGFRLYRHRCWPGRLLLRRATWQHRVILLKDKKGEELPATTLVWMGPRVRPWGFWDIGGWIEWREFLRQRGCE